MYLQHPIFPLIMTIFTLFMIIIQSIQNEKLLKGRFITAIINVILAVAVYILYFNIIEKNNLLLKIYFYYSIFTYVFYFFVFISVFRTSTLKANHYQLFVKSIRESRWNAYYIVDKRERIKDISQTFLEELDMKKEEVIGKKLFNIFNKSIRFLQYNGTEINNRQLENYYLEYRKNAKVGDSEIEEIVVSNFEGKQVIFKLVMQPVYVLGKYKGRIVVGERKTDFDLLGVEKKLNEKNKHLESIQSKFIATLEISKEGLYYADLDARAVWVSDTLKTLIGLPDNSLELNDFRKLIYPDDLNAYMALLANLSLSKQNYYIKYRLLANGTYIWVEERGKRVFDDPYTTTIMGTINPINAKHFRNTNIEILDMLGTEHDLLVKMNNLVTNDHYFYTMLIELKNIPHINESHGWEVGNMALAEYIKQMYTSFITENGGIYRLTGLKFAVIITDPRKMDYLQKGIRVKETFLNYQMSYGSILLDLSVFGGISISKEDGNTAEQLLDAANEALKIAKNPHFSYQAVFYKDLEK